MRILVFSLCLLLTGGGRYALHTAFPAGKQASLKEILLLPPGKVIRQLDLGHHSLAADLLFIRANLYYGQHILSDQQLPWMSDFIDILLQVDPDFRKAYLWAAMVTVFPKREMHFTPQDLVLRANRILETGLTRFPEDHRFSMRLAFNHYYELGDVDAAIPYFRRAADTPGAPRWLRQKLADLYQKKDPDLARETILQMIAEEEDPVLSDALKRRLQSIMGREQSAELVARRQALVRQWHDEYPHLQFDLYLLIREP